MAETLNYRMNLVLEPKNVIKANRELRAMERYFERIQGRVLRIGRTRMAPEIVLKDRASAGLDRILGKIHRVKSQMIDASGTVNLRVKQEESSGKRHSMKASPMPKIALVFPDFDPIVRALSANSLASIINSRLISVNSVYLANLTNALGSISLGGATPGKEKEEAQPKSFWEKFKSGVTFVKNATATVKGAVDTKRAWGELKNDWRPEVGNTKIDKVKNTAKEIWKNKGKILDMASSATDALEGGTGVADSVMGLFSGGRSSGSGAITKAISEVAESGSRIASKLLLTGGKRAMGPLGYVFDAYNIAAAKPGKERAKAIGSATGGAIGSVVGSALGSVLLPGIGTFVGGAVGGVAGDFIGGKLGGVVSDSLKSASGWFSKNIMGKKDKTKEKEDISRKSDVITAPYNPDKKPILQNSPYNPKNPPAVHTAPLIQGLSLPSTTPSYPYYPIHAGMMASQNPNILSPGPRMQSAATNNAVTDAGKLPQVVQISPEQMTALSGQMRDFKTETATNYNLPPGAVQVTVHEEHRVDVEGLIQQVGQRLRAEFQRAAQNQKPVTRAYQ